MLWPYVLLGILTAISILQMRKTSPMSDDPRNQGLVGMSDGIPLFRDKHSRSVIPILLRTANMNDHLSMKFRYTHMTGLVPSHFWIIGEISKQFERVERKPSHLCALMHVIVEPTQVGDWTIRWRSLKKRQRSNKTVPLVPPVVVLVRRLPWSRWSFGFQSCTRWIEILSLVRGDREEKHGNR